MSDWFKASSAQENDPEQHDDLPFSSRRSPIICRNGCVATSQPLASSIGLDLLRKGANAADVAVAVAAALAVTEPCSTGLGGDMFCLYYDSQTRKVSCINGSGKSPAALTWNLIREKYSSEASTVDESKFRDSVHAITVPGAAKGWEDLLSRHGSGQFTFVQLLEPAAQLAEEGFPVSPITSHHWKSGLYQITRWLDENDGAIPLTKDGKNAPCPGDIMTNKDLADTLRELGSKGSEHGFYRGRAGRAIVEAAQKHGGCITLQDLQNHTSTFPEPIYAEYRECKLWQAPPNGQGIAGLIALTGLKHVEENGMVHVGPDTIGNADVYHAMIEMMRLGFADNRTHVADLEFMNVEIDTLLDSDRIRERAIRLFDPRKATIHGIPDASSCTVSFQVVDATGNAISFVNSNFMGFGNGIVPKGCGFTLQNRGAGFSLEEGHPNVVAPSKRPFHTIIPGMLTHCDTDELYATISNMGGNMQPQGHLQLTVNMLAGGLNPQEAIDMPRFCIADGTQKGAVFLEKGVGVDVVEILRQRGHFSHANIMGHQRSLMGRAQIIKRDRANGVLWAGSDGRADGCAIGY